MWGIFPRRPVTLEVAGSSPVDPANLRQTLASLAATVGGPRHARVAKVVHRSRERSERSAKVDNYSNPDHPSHSKRSKLVTFENSSALESIFGRWPSFHDAEMLRVVLDRSGDEGPTLEAVIRVFEMTSDVDPKGYYVLKNHTE